MFIRNDWYTAAWSREVTHILESKPLARTICGEPVVLFRDANGKAAALEDRCAHRGAPLRCGEVVAEGIQCGYHGLVYDGGGRCVHVPGQSDIPPRANIKSYPLVERDEFLWIWIGDPEKADPSKIVSYPFNNDYKNWPHKSEVYHVQCNFMLLIDNLMDLTHLGFVHKSTIGGNPKVHVEAKTTIERKPNGIKYTRWMLDSVPPPTYSKAVPFKGRIDRWQEFELITPGTIVQFSGATDAGTGAYEGKRDGGFALRLYHGITPETERTSHYFWCGANGYRQDDPAATEQLFQELSAAFKEDLTIIAAQQATQEHFKTQSYVDIKSDSVRTQARKMLDRRILESLESSEAATSPVAT
jgi:phenylpropionate dioxygenase-like ring-hydroxylating dioxygenase large terminal subunit